MAKYIIRRKNNRRIFEEGEVAAPAQQGQPAPAAPANQGTQPAAQPTAQGNGAQPATPNQTAPATTGTDNQQANQQTPNQNAQPQQPAQPSEKETKVTECMNQINAVVQKNDPYALLALNIPDLIKQNLPKFAEDATSKDTMDKWEAFKKGPSAESFKAFTDAFVTYGKGGQETQQNQQQPQQTPPAQNAVTQQAESEYRSFTFAQRLNEKLQNRLKISNAAKSFQNYNPFNF